MWILTKFNEIVNISTLNRIMTERQGNKVDVVVDSEMEKVTLGHYETDDEANKALQTLASRMGVLRMD